MMNVRLYLFFFSIAFCSTVSARAQYRTLGIGAMIGSPTGISLKKWTSRTRAYDFGAAWSVGKDPGIQIHGDFLLHRSDLEGMQAGRSYAYYGIGGRFKVLEAESRVGVRFPLGLTYVNPEEPFDVFFEVVPILNILPETRFVLNLSLGGRFYLSGNRNRY